MRKGLYLSTWLHAAKIARERVFEALFSGRPKRRRGRRGGRRRQKQQLVLCHETRQRPAWWPSSAEVVASKPEVVVAKAVVPKPKRWNLVLSDAGVGAVVAGPIRWAFELDAEARYGEDVVVPCMGMRKGVTSVDPWTCTGRSMKVSHHYRPWWRERSRKSFRRMTE